MQVRSVWVEATIVGVSIALAVLLLQGLPSDTGLGLRALAFLVLGGALCLIQIAVSHWMRGK